MYLTKRQRDIYNCIYRFIKKNGYAPSLEEICSRVGVSSLATIHKHLKNLEQKGVISRKWNKGRSIEINAPVLYPDAVELPLLGEISAGKQIEPTEHTRTIGIPQEIVSSEESFLLRVKGDSLKDEYLRDGDYLIIERRAVPEPGEMVVAFVENQGTVVRRFFRGEDDNIRLESENPKKKPVFVPEESLRIRGVIIGVLRRYK
ncbi:repressor LexA [Candidatus Sumerlaeota bacterium]|nr:repressor LexA [Candidatus Sumerlaeota bacterium]